MVFSHFLRLEAPSNFTAFAFLTGLLAGCGDEAPPYDVLPLRDALRAAPEVVATLPEDSRRDLALRFEEAAGVDPETLAFASEALSLEPLVTSADAAREADGKDALVLGEMLATEGHALLEAHSVSETDLANAAPIAVQGQATDMVVPFEEAALRGRAGQTLRGFVARTHAKSVVRMTGLPIGAVAWNDKVYVNESWLVALSALEAECVATPVPEAFNENPATPGASPLSVDFSPFDLPANLAQCSAQVQKTCACGQTMSCAHEPTDRTFSDANAECAWVNQQSANASAICILALMSLDTVKECVASASPQCSFMPVNNRDTAVSFVMDDMCRSILDACLQNGTPPNQGNTSSGSGDACSDCRYCDGQGDDCQQCAGDCKTFLETCELCIEICAICAENAERKTARDNEAAYKFAYVHSVNQCSLRKASPKSPLPAPVGTALWLFAPIGYLLLRSRRRM